MSSNLALLNYCWIRSTITGKNSRTITKETTILVEGFIHKVI